MQKTFSILIGIVIIAAAVFGLYSTGNPQMHHLMDGVFSKAGEFIDKIAMITPIK
ncbi:hypothetical protein [Apilactobacillus timberlakei]|uniref:hypothetical protein n=1 Tax=Apilactobacillus timberlakei TaxID=2008380 RepID=UPI0015E86844|nr:hypothetical protein [Apilactobacillus timberlakei]